MPRRSARRLRYFAAAARDYEAQLAYYAAAAPRLEMAFAMAIKTAESLIHASPQGFAKLGGASEIRVVVVRGFPFRLLYLVRGNDVFVVAVAHTSRAIDIFTNRT